MTDRQDISRLLRAIADLVDAGRYAPSGDEPDKVFLAILMGDLHERLYALQRKDEGK